MYLAIFSALTWLSIATISHACTIKCPPGQIVCVGPNGMSSTCVGFKGCHERCPPGTFGGPLLGKGSAKSSSFDGCREPNGLYKGDSCKVCCYSNNLTINHNITCTKRGSYENYNHYTSSTYLRNQACPDACPKCASCLLQHEEELKSLSPPQQCNPEDCEVMNIGTDPCHSPGSCGCFCEKANSLLSKCPDVTPKWHTETITTGNKGKQLGESCAIKRFLKDCGNCGEGLVCGPSGMLNMCGVCKQKTDKVKIPIGKSSEKPGGLSSSEENGGASSSDEMGGLSRSEENGGKSIVEPELIALPEPQKEGESCGGPRIWEYGTRGKCAPGLECIRKDCISAGRRPCRECVKPKGNTGELSGRQRCQSCISGCKQYWSIGMTPNCCRKCNWAEEN